MLYCKSCNAEVGKTDSFCQKCGTKLPNPTSSTGETAFHVMRICFSIFLLCGNWIKINLSQWLMHLFSIKDTSFSWFDVADVLGIILKIGEYSGAKINPLVQLIPYGIQLFLIVVISMFVLAAIGIIIRKKWGHVLLEKADGGFSIIWLFTALFVWITNAIIDEKTNGLIGHLFSFTSVYHMVWFIIIAYMVAMPYFKRNAIKEFLFELKETLQQK